MKKIIPIFGVWLGAFVLQIALMWLYYPSKDLFSTTEVKSGLYTFDGGAVRTAATSTINGEIVSCGVSVVGPENSCSSELHNKIVTAKFVKLPTIFGPSPVLVEASIAGKTVLKYTPEQQIKYWRDLSVISAIRWSVIVAGVFFVAYRLLAKH